MVGVTVALEGNKEFKVCTTLSVCLAHVVIHPSQLPPYIALCVHISYNCSLCLSQDFWSGILQKAGATVGGTYLMWYFEDDIGYFLSPGSKTLLQCMYSSPTLLYNIIPTESGACCVVSENGKQLSSRLRGRADRGKGKLQPLVTKEWVAQCLIHAELLNWSQFTWT